MKKSRKPREGKGGGGRGLAKSTPLIGGARLMRA